MAEESEKRTRFLSAWMSAFAFPSTCVLDFFLSQRKSSWWLLIVGFFYSPFLSVIQCEQLSAPANGRVTQPSSFGLNSVTSFTCNSGYRLMGSEQRTCQAAGTWDGSPTTCNRKAQRYLFAFSITENEVGASSFSFFFLFVFHQFS